MDTQQLLERTRSILNVEMQMGELHWKVESWHETINPHPGRFEVVCKGSIFVNIDDDGNMTDEMHLQGTLERAFILRENSLIVDHRDFDLEWPARRRGFGRAYLTLLAGRYQQMGVEAITTWATGEGSAAWSKLGFELLDDVELENLLTQLLAQADRDKASEEQSKFRATSELLDTAYQAIIDSSEEALEQWRDQLLSWGAVEEAELLVSGSNARAYAKERIKDGLSAEATAPSISEIARWASSDGTLKADHVMPLVSWTGVARPSELVPRLSQARPQLDQALVDPKRPTSPNTHSVPTR